MGELILSIGDAPFTALFADSPWKKLSQKRPFVLAVRLNEHAELLVLLHRPRPFPFDDARVEDIAPVLHALHLSGAYGRRGEGYREVVRCQRGCKVCEGCEGYEEGKRGRGKISYI